MELYNNYLLTSSPPQTRTNTNIKMHPLHKMEDLPKVYKKRSESLMSIYSSRFKEMTAPLSSRIHEPTPSPDRKDSPKARNTITSLIIRNKSNRVEESPTHAVNQYAEQLRKTLVNEYKIQNKLSGNTQNDNPIEAKAIQELEILKQLPPPKIQAHNQTLTPLPLPTKTVAFKTLNLLYKAIIDNSFHKRKKEDFELQANKLPIVQRANSHEKKPKPLHHLHHIPPPPHHQTPQKPQIFQSPTVTIVRRTKHPFRPSTRLQRQQQLQIIPWATSQQLLL